MGCEQSEIAKINNQNIQIPQSREPRKSHLTSYKPSLPEIQEQDTKKQLEGGESAKLFFANKQQLSNKQIQHQQIAEQKSDHLKDESFKNSNKADNLSVQQDMDLLQLRSIQNVSSIYKSKTKRQDKKISGRSSMTQRTGQNFNKSGSIDSKKRNNRLDPSPVMKELRKIYHV